MSFQHFSLKTQVLKSALKSAFVRCKHKLLIWANKFPTVCKSKEDVMSWLTSIAQ